MASGLGAIILAAGLSSRMGRLKPILPLGGGTLLGQCIEVLREGGVADIVVVCGHCGEEVAAAAQVYSARPVCNPHFKEGMYSSIMAGVQALSPTTSTVFLLPVDMPLIRLGTVSLLAQAMANAGNTPQVAHPVFRDERGHPLCIRAKLLHSLCKQEGPPSGLRPLLAAHEQAHPVQVAEVRVADANILVDLDTPEAYRQGCALFAQRDYPAVEEAEVIVQHIHLMPDKGLAHGRLVGELAGIFAAAINRRRGSNLLIELCQVGGLLHDVAKGQANHETQGALWLGRLGFPRVAAIIAAHKDLDWQESQPLGERELVHLADKLIRGRYLFPIDARFAEKLAQYAHDQEAVVAIRKRHTLAKQLAQAVEEACGCELATLCNSLAATHLPTSDCQPVLWSPPF